jgi:hypothetical protein
VRFAASVLIVALLTCVGALWPQEQVWVCPMDPDVRSSNSGVCPRCGMKLVAGLPDIAEYQMDLSTSPQTLRPGEPAQLIFAIRDPWKGRPVNNFQVVHERLFHMFIIGQDLEFFVHDHPALMPGGTFRYEHLKLPKAGMYRVLGDFYPDGATPQLIAKTILVPGAPPAPVHLARDYSAKDAANLHVEFRTDPPQAIAGMNTQLHFVVGPGDGFEKYLGAWGHMLVASEDLIDLIHTHPFAADGGPHLQFNVTFPRPGTYRVWVQFQRKGIVNTAHFDVPVEELRQ